MPDFAHGNVLTTAAQATETTTSSGSASSGGFIVDPWVGLIVLCVLVITGAIAVIREIRIEDDENK